MVEAMQHSFNHPQQSSLVWDLGKLAGFPGTVVKKEMEKENSPKGVEVNAAPASAASSVEMGFPYELRVLNSGECDRCIYKCEGPAKLRGLSCVLGLVPKHDDGCTLKTWLETFGAVGDILQLRVSMEKRERKFSGRASTGSDTENDDSKTVEEEDDCAGIWKPVDDSGSIITCTVPEKGLRFGPNNLVLCATFGIHKDWKLGKKQDNQVEYRFRFSVMCDQMVAFSTPFQIKSKRRKLALAIKEVEWSGKQNHVIDLVNSVEKLNGKIRATSEGNHRLVILSHEFPLFKKQRMSPSPVVVPSGSEKRAREGELGGDMNLQQPKRQCCGGGCAEMIEKQNLRIAVLEDTVRNLIMMLPRPPYY